DQFWAVVVDERGGRLLSRDELTVYVHQLKIAAVVRESNEGHVGPDAGGNRAVGRTVNPFVFGGDGQAAEPAGYASVTHLELKTRRSIVKARRENRMASGHVVGLDPRLKEESVAHVQRVGMLDLDIIVDPVER